ncbi:MAG: 30S ribosomal protein S4 [archaeon]|nr:30S ribosomal protein S4 [archaeon]
MGDPRRLKKKFKRPTSPYNKARIESELKYVGDYGLRNKREFWKHKYQLSTYRRIARDLRSKPEELQIIGYGELTGKLNRLGLVSQDATTDDILSLSIEDILNRRLQSLVFKKGLAKSIYQARQLVVHKHIAVGGKIIASPSYLVKKNEEDNLSFDDYSPFKGDSAKLYGSTKPQSAEKEKSSKKETKKKTTRKTSSKPTRKRTKKTTKKTTKSEKSEEKSEK